MNLPFEQEEILYDRNNVLELFKQNSVLILFEQLTRFSASFVNSIYNYKGVNNKNQNILAKTHCQLSINCYFLSLIHSNSLHNKSDHAILRTLEMLIYKPYKLHKLYKFFKLFKNP